MDLIRDPIPSLLSKIAIPASIGMFFNTMYYVVDNFYAGMLSSSALAGISLAAPIVFLGLAIAVGIGQGTNALVGNALGEGNESSALKIAGHALSFSVLSALGVGFIIWLCLPALYTLMAARGDYTDLASTYLSIILPTLSFMAYGMAANGILNALGDTKSLRNSLVVACFTNMLLDPLFIFVFDMGIMGLALATTMTQLGSAIYLTYKLATSRLANCLSRTNLKPNWRYYYALIEQSLPASSNMFLVALGSFLITSAVARFGENAVAGLGIALRIEQLVLLPTIGINIAVLSLISVNYGAKQHQRMASIAHKAIQVGTTMMIAGGILISLLAEELLNLFTDNTAVINVGISYLYVEAIILPAYVLSFVAGAVLQGMKRPMIPMYFNIIRQLILPFSFIVIALMILNTSVTGIWWSIALATWLTAALQFVHMKRAVALTSQNASTN